MFAHRQTETMNPFNSNTIILWLMVNKNEIKTWYHGIDWQNPETNDLYNWSVFKKNFVMNKIIGLTHNYR